MKPLAILLDSWRETLDRKSFLLMSCFAGLLIVLCASVGFRPLGEREAVTSIVSNFNLVFRSSGRAWSRRYEKAMFDVVEFRRGDGYLLKLRGSPPAEVTRLVRHWDAVRLGKCKEETDPVPEADLPVEPLLLQRFLETRFREGLIPDVIVSPAGPMEWDVTLHAAGARALAGAEEMSVLFGAFTGRPRLPGPVPSARRYLSSAHVAALAEVALGEVVGGMVGILIAIVVTAGSVPGMLQKGTLDLLLARPVERSTLLVVKFLGGCLQVFVISTLLIGGCWIAISARTGHWNAWFPLTILTLTFFFALLHSVSVLVGVMTRSRAAAACAALLTWVACFGVGKAREHFASPDGIGAPQGLVAAVRIAHLLLPKTWDLGLLNQQIISRGQLGEVAAAIPEWMPVLPLWTVLGTSLLFAVLMISLAGMHFSRQDC